MAPTESSIGTWVGEVEIVEVDRVDPEVAQAVLRVRTDVSRLGIDQQLFEREADLQRMRLRTVGQGEAENWRHGDLLATPANRPPSTNCSL